MSNPLSNMLSPFHYKSEHVHKRDPEGRSRYCVTPDNKPRSCDAILHILAEGKSITHDIILNFGPPFNTPEINVDSVFSALRACEGLGIDDTDPIAAWWETASGVHLNQSPWQRDAATGRHLRVV